MQPSPSGPPPPVLEGLGSGRAGGVREGLDRRRDSLHLPQMRGGRREATRGPRTAQAATAVAGVLGTRNGDSRRHGRRPSGDSRAPGGRPRDQGGDADRARHDPGEVRGLRPQEVGPWTPGLRAPGSARAASSQGRPREGRISGTAATAPGGRGGGGGKLSPRLGERPGGPG